jgi:hypothetical protein
MAFLLTVLLALSALQDSAKTGTAGIEGVVTRAGTSQPIEKARVVVSNDRGAYFETNTDGDSPWLSQDISPAGVTMIRSLLDGVDPQHNFNPGKII